MGTESHLSESWSQSAVRKPDGGRDLFAAVLKAVAGIRYGSVELIIHDGRLVQIDRKEKMRFDKCESCPKK